MFNRCLAFYKEHISAKSYNDCVEKLIMLYGNELDDDKILDTIEDWEQLRENI